MAKKKAKLEQVRQGGVDLTYQIMLDELQCHLRENPNKIPLVLRYAEKLDSDPTSARDEAKVPSGIPLSRTTLGSVAEGTLRKLLGEMCERFTLWAPRVNKNKDKDLWLHLICAATQSSPQDKITNAQHRDMDTFFSFYIRKYRSMNQRLLQDISLVYNHEQGFDWQKHGLYALVGLTEDALPDHACQVCTHVLYKGSSVMARLCANIRFEKDKWLIEQNWSDEGAQLVSQTVPRTTIRLKDVMAQSPEWPQMPHRDAQVARSQSAASEAGNSASSTAPADQEPEAGFAKAPEAEREDL